MSNSTKPPIASFHTPAALLSIARELVATGNPKYYRGAILEANAALESVVSETVFSAIQRKHTKEFSDWCKKVTKWSLDDKLSTLVPFATGLTIDTKSPMWNDYKEARALRNSVAHGGRPISLDDANRIIANIAEWLSYLGSTLEVETALIQLKNWIESQPATVINSGIVAEEIVKQFFIQSSAASVSSQPVFSAEGKCYRPDIILDFGTRKVLVEVKFSPQQSQVSILRDKGIQQVEGLLAGIGTMQACVVILAKKKGDEQPEVVLKHASGNILSIVIYFA